MTNDLVSLLEITRKCNLKCKHCYNYKLDTRNERIELRINEFELIMQKLVDGGINQFILTGGEPLLFKNLGSSFEVMRKYQDLLISINTNGTLLLKKDILKIFLDNKDLITQLNISIESANAVIHDFIRGKGQFNNILKVLELCSQEEFPLLVNTTIGSYNIGSIESIFSLMDKYEIYNVNFGLYIPWHSDIKGLKPLTRDQANLICDVLLEKAENGWNIQTCSMPYLKFFSPGIEGMCCSLFRELFTVNAKGELTVCMMDDFKVGSVLELDLDQLMKNEIAREFLHPENLRTKIEGKCKTCEKFEECLGCRFIAYAVTQNYYASDPYCPYYFPP